MNITKTLKPYGVVGVIGAVIIAGASLSSAHTRVAYTATNTATVHVNDTITLTQDVPNPAPSTTCTLSAVQTSGPATLTLTRVGATFTTSTATVGDYTVNVICTGDEEHASPSPSPSVSHSPDDTLTPSHPEASPSASGSPDADDYVLTTTWTIHVLSGSVVGPYTYTVSILGWVQSTRSRANDRQLSLARGNAVRSYLQGRGLTADRFAVGGKGVRGSGAKARSARVVVIWHGPTSGAAMTTVYFTPGSSALSRPAKLRLRAFLAGLPH